LVMIRGLLERWKWAVLCHKGPALSRRKGYLKGVQVAFRWWKGYLKLNFAVLNCSSAFR